MDDKDVYQKVSEPGVSPAVAGPVRSTKHDRMSPGAALRHPSPIMTPPLRTCRCATPVPTPIEKGGKLQTEFDCGGLSLSDIISGSTTTACSTRGRRVRLHA